MGDDQPLLSTAETAKRLGIARRTLQRWVQERLVEPDLTTAGGHHRFNPDNVRRQLRELRERDD